MNNISSSSINKTEELTVSTVSSIPSTLDEGSYVEDDQYVDPTTRTQQNLFSLSADDAAANDTDSDFGAATNPDIEASNLDSLYNDVNGDTDFGLLGTPSNLVIKYQTARQTSDAKTVIDVVLGCDDVINAINYEVRVTKI